MVRSTLLVATGAALIAGTVVDVFGAVLHYDRHGWLTSRLYRVVWALTRAASRVAPGRSRDLVRSLGLPLMILASVVVWALLIATGFALLYYDGFTRGAFTLTPGLEPTFADALYVSGTTLSTVGFGDLTPRTPPYQAMAVFEAFLGFGLLTLTLSYLISVYQILQGLNVLTASLTHQSEDHHGDHAIAILEPHFPHGVPRELSTRLHWLHLQLLSYHEALHRYPLVYYFASDRPYNSMPYTMLLLGEIIGALRWGLPEGHESTCDPWLLALVQDYRGVMVYVNQRFGGAAEHPGPVPVDRRTFAAQLDAGPEHCDPEVRRFLAVDAAMHRVVGLHGRVDADHLHGRYVGWLGFAGPASAFVRRAAEHLAYDIALLDPDHDRQLL